METTSVPGETAHFTPSESVVLRLLLRRAGTTVLHEAVVVALYSMRPDADAPKKPLAVVKTLVCRARAKLTAHRIVPVRGTGYRMETK
jgi:DNA-binding response OmpR family regulator